MARHSVEFSNRQRAVAADKPLRDLLRACCAVLFRQEQVKFACTVSVSFVDEREMQSLNRQNRGKDAVTDVLSFPLETFQNGIPPGYKPPIKPLPLGDVVLCMPRAAQQAQDYGHSLQREIGFLTVHSLLHLLGYDHDSTAEQSRMDQKCESALRELGLARASQP